VRWASALVATPSRVGVPHFLLSALDVAETVAPQAESLAREAISASAQPDITATSVA